MSRAKSLAPRTERAFDIATTAGDDFSGQVVREDLSDSAKWRPNFASARLDMHASGIEGAHLPGADFRGVESPEFVPGVPVYMMAEARGAIIDDALVSEATEGDLAWLLVATEETPRTNEARTALDFVVPFLQWSFTNSQWNQLLAEGYDPDELVLAAQEFPPRNDRGFRIFMDTGDAARSLNVSPHRQAWGDRELTLPPSSNARTRQKRAARSRQPR